MIATKDDVIATAWHVQSRKSRHLVIGTTSGDAEQSEVLFVPNGALFLYDRVEMPDILSPAPRGLLLLLGGILLIL